jgi:catechol 2,3-dioxygenase-like lactoylglutathione lyase family enzyme
MRTQVTFDCADPHAQAAFWAEVLGCQVEDHSELVDQLVATGRLPAEDVTTVAGRSAFRQVAACSDPAGVEPRLYFQQVPEGKTSKNRVHLDIHVDEERKTAEAERLVALGAQITDENADRGPRTIVMRDPEGNEFCLH